MNHFRLLKISSVLFALTAGGGYLNAANVLSSSVTSVSLACTTGSPCVTGGSIIASATDTLSVDSSTAGYSFSAPTVPWLKVSNGTSVTTGTVAANPTITFSVTSAWTTLNAGLNSTTITITNAPVGGTATTGGPFVITVYLQVQAAAPTLQVKGGLNVLNPVNYIAASPTVALVMSFTVVSSSGLPVPFTASITADPTTPQGTASGWLTMQAGSASGIAYSWGTTISVVASQPAIASAYPGDYLTGTVTIVPNGVAANDLIVPVNISIGAGTPTVTSVSPGIVPLEVSGVAPGFVNVVLKGTGFVAAPAAQKTKVFWGTTAAISGCTNLILTDYVTVLSPNYLQVAIPYSSTGVPFATAGATSLYVGIANGATPSVCVSQVALGVTSAPIIAGVTSASSFVDTAPGVAPNVAPYDIISIFGTNLCPACTGTNNVLVGVLDVNNRFPVYLSPDGGTHKITVPFTKTALGTPLPGYLLFATNTQINVAVPGGLTSSYINLQVAYDTSTPPAVPAAANTSAVFPITYVAYDPGIFTIEASGQGQGAITNASTYVLNSQTAAANSTTPDTISIYMTGLGVPDSTATPSTTPTAWTGPASCLAPLGTVGTSSTAPTGYMGTVNTPYFSSVTGTGFQQLSSTYAVPSPLWASIDGAIINSNFLGGNLPPCLNPLDLTTALLTVTIGGVGQTAANAGITYAGFVSGSIVGLYQINVVTPVPTTPSGFSAGVASQYPVVVTLGTATSQAGVTMWIK
jgi:uncharacterized protein (TIGR03437 family)